MTAPNPEVRLKMAQALADAFWRTAERPMNWDSNSSQQRQVWLEMADAAFAAGRDLKARSSAQLREIAA